MLGVHQHANSMPALLSREARGLALFAPSLGGDRSYLSTASMTLNVWRSKLASPRLTVSKSAAAEGSMGPRLKNRLKAEQQFRVRLHQSLSAHVYTKSFGKARPMENALIPQVDIGSIVGKTSWILRNKSVRVALTQDGGHMAPVTFYLPDGTPVEPYYVSPWGADALPVPADEPCIAFIRGDFFCFPFGNGGENDDKRYLLHGEPAYAPGISIAFERKTGSVSFASQ